MKRLPETDTSLAAYDTALRITMTLDFDVRDSNISFHTYMMFHVSVSVYLYYTACTVLQRHGCCTVVSH